MADTLTPVLGLHKPDFEGTADIRTISTDMDILDTFAGGVTPQLVLPVRGPTGGLLLGGDTNLYSPSANVLMSDDQFQSTGDLHAREASAQKVVVGAVGANAGLLLGTTGDVNLYRPGADTLRTDDAFVVAGALTAQSTLAVTGGATVGGALAVTGDLTVTGAINQVTNQQAVTNLLTNPGFDTWARGVGPFTANGAYTADRWQLNLGASSTISVSRDTANADAGSVYCLAATYTHVSVTYLNQALENYQELRGRTVTASLRVKTTTPGAVRVRLNTGVTTADSAFHTGGGTHETLAVSIAVPTNATYLYVQVSFAASCTAYLDSAVLVAAAAAPPYSPLHPVDNLARCQRYYYEIGGLDGNEVVATMMYFAGAARGALQFPVEMATAPTVTISVAGDWAVYNSAGGTQVCTALVAGQITRRNCMLIATIASGLANADATVLYANATTAARLRFEANP